MTSIIGTAPHRRQSTPNSGMQAVEFDTPQIISQLQSAIQEKNCDELFRLQTSISTEYCSTEEGNLLFNEAISLAIECQDFTLIDLLIQKGELNHSNIDGLCDVIPKDTLSPVHGSAYSFLWTILSSSIKNEATVEKLITLIDCGILEPAFYDKAKNKNYSEPILKALQEKIGSEPSSLDRFRSLTPRRIEEPDCDFKTNRKDEDSNQPVSLLQAIKQNNRGAFLSLLSSLSPEKIENEYSQNSDLFDQFMLTNADLIDALADLLNATDQTEAPE